MKNKILASAFVLGFVLAPTTAFATQVTTIQGGTPVYSCPNGQELIGQNCVLPATTTTQEEQVPSSSYQATSTVTGTQYSSAMCSPGGSAYNAGYRFNTSTSICRHPGYGDPFTPADTKIVNIYSYSCPNGGSLSSTTCTIPATTRTITVPVPAVTSPATITGSTGGSLVASITAFVTPIWNYLTDHLLPAIGLLVVLAIGVRLSIRAVRKFSKVA